MIERTAGAIHACLRGHDLVARLGGEEFAALLPVADVATARAAAERTRDRLRRLRPVAVTLSIGSPRENPASPWRHR